MRRPRLPSEILAVASHHERPCRVRANNSIGFGGRGGWLLLCLRAWKSPGIDPVEASYDIELQGNACSPSTAICYGQPEHSRPLAVQQKRLRGDLNVSGTTFPANLDRRPGVF